MYKTLLKTLFIMLTMLRVINDHERTEVLTFPFTERSESVSVKQRAVLSARPPVAVHTRTVVFGAIT